MQNTAISSFLNEFEKAQNQINGLTREQLVSISKNAETAVSFRIYALKLLKELEELFIPVFGVNEELK